MPRRPRIATGGIAFHAMNRAAGRVTLFRTDDDYAAFERVLAEVHARLPMRLLSYCVMPNHWHLVPWPRGDGELSEFLRLVTVTHAQRWHAAHGTSGMGPLYQGRFKSFPIQRDPHLLLVCRYVERNAVRANLVRAAARWRWCSAWQRAQAAPAAWVLPQAEWPVDVPRNWASLVDQPLTEAETEAVQRSVRRGAPLGSERWAARTAERLGLQSTLHPRGRPRKSSREGG